MGSDRARSTYDPAREYRSVVHQQGRVIVEADLNEAQQLRAEETREALLDVIGPAGTPDDGYRISFPLPNPNRDFDIGAGTFYLGGVREALKAAIKHSNQPDWVDGPDAVPANAQRELVFLVVQEQEVSAVEDGQLREVALGGPDTAQRTRFLQRVHRRQVTATTGVAAVAEAASAWLAQGARFDAATMRLQSTAQLRVGLVPPTATPSPCSPVAAAGYLGAENQLLRVQISGSNRFVWANDNASALYPASVTVAGASLTITLEMPPVDAHHFPIAGQRVEILRAAARLPDGEFAAALSGVVVPSALTTNAYNPDTRTITVSGSVATEFTSAGAAGRPLFVRIWEEERTFTPGTAQQLGATGLTVTLTGAAFIVGDHWTFAARPSTPNEVFPPAALSSARTPDGPRRWLTPLALIGWPNGAGVVLEDLRPVFDNLVELTRRGNSGGCCTVTLRPDDLTGGVTLQSVIDKFRNTLNGGARVNICLLPGIYRLREPLRLDQTHEGLTLEGCHDGAVLEVERDFEGKFLEGMVVMTYADGVTFRNLRFHLPQVDFAANGGTLSGRTLAQLGSLGLSSLQGLRVSIGLRPAHCANLRLEDCLFRFSLTQGEDVFGAGVFATSECWGLHVEGCRFLHKDNYLRVKHDPPRMLFGYLLVPSTSFVGDGQMVATGRTARSLLNDAVFRDNVFSGLTAATLIYADMGVVKFEENRVRECFSGFWLIALRTPIFNEWILRVIGESVPALVQLVSLPLVQFGSAIARAYRPPPGLQDRHFRTVNFATQTPQTLHSALVAVEYERYLDVELLYPRLHLALHAADNDVTAQVPGADDSASAFVLFGVYQDESGSVIIGTNRMSNRGRLPTACIVLAARCVATGNLIINDGAPLFRDASSLIVFSADEIVSNGVAVSGNVFRGPAQLPSRTTSLGQPFETWLPFNSFAP